MSPASTLAAAALLAGGVAGAVCALALRSGLAEA